MEMLTAGDEKSSPTGTVLSPSSGPNGKKVIGTAGSRMLSTRTAKSSRTTTENSDRDVDVISAQQVRAVYVCRERAARLAPFWPCSLLCCYFFVLLTAGAMANGPIAEYL